jgi:hypothetical protein
MPIFNYSNIHGQMPYSQGMNVLPSVNDDWNAGYCDGSLWQYFDPSTQKITMYMCISSSIGSAVWVAIATQP